MKVGEGHRRGKGERSVELHTVFMYEILKTNFKNFK